MSSKCDPHLGAKVRAHLLEKGIETPIAPTGLAEDEKIDLIESRMRDVMIALGLDIEDDSLAETPKRVAKMYVKELFWGLDPDKFPKCTTVQNKMGYNAMVIERCTVKSSCEHHLIYFGTAHDPDGLGAWVAYIPNEKVLGLSKLNRIVSYFAHRPQIQERLTEQVFHALQYILETEDVAVLIKSQHFCVLARGVEDENSYTVTSKLGGAFYHDPTTRSEFMSLCRS